MTKDTSTGVTFKDTVATVKTTLRILNQPDSFGVQRNVLSYRVQLLQNVVACVHTSENNSLAILRGVRETPGRSRCSTDGAVAVSAKNSETRLRIFPSCCSVSIQRR